MNISQIFFRDLLFPEVELPDTQLLETLSQGSELQMILLPFQEEVQALETALDALESHAEHGNTQELEKVLRMLGDFMDKWW